MDKTTTPNPGREIFNRDWETEFADLISRFRESSLLKETKIHMPFGYDNKTGKFGPIQKYEVKERRSKKLDLYIMNLFLKKTKQDQINCGLEQNFVMEISKEYKLLDEGFSYSWDYNKNKVKIIRYLGSYDKEVVLENAQKLLKQCSFFKMMYDVGKKKKKESSYSTSDIIWF